jgi:hypothetical protein
MDLRRFNLLTSTLILALCFGTVAGFVEVNELPASVVGFLSNEQINVYMVGPDRVSTVTGFIIGDEIIIEKVEGGLEKPSISIFLTNRLVGHLDSSSNPMEEVKKKLESGEMKIRGNGILKSFKVNGFLEGVKESSPENELFHPKEIPPSKSVITTLGELGKNNEGHYVISGGKSSGFRLIKLSIDELSPETSLNVESFSNLNYNEVPRGVKSSPCEGME